MAPQSPLVSVCIPTYNGERYLAAAVESILAQTFHDLECLIVDDASTDGTLAVARSFADRRVRIHPGEKRLGIGGNCNRCIELARGEYIFLIGQDDLMLPDNVARKVAVLAADPFVGFVHSSAELLTADSGATATIGRYAESDRITDGAVRFRELLLGANDVCASSVGTRRQALRDAGGFNTELSYACDYEMWLKLCVHRRVAFLAHSLVKYRWHDRNMSHDFRAEQRIEEILQAGRRALVHYRRTSGCHDADALAAGLEAASKMIRYAAQLEQGNAWLEQSKAQVEQSKAQVEQGKAQVEQGNAWLETQVGNWQRATENLTAVNAALEKHIADLTAARAEVQGHVVRLLAANDALKAQIVGLEAANSELKDRVGVLEQKNLWFSARVAMLEKSLLELRETAEREQTNLNARLAAVEDTRWVHFGRKLGLVPPDARKSA